MYTVLLFFHFIGLALGVGTGFATLVLGLATRDLSPPDRTTFMLRASTVGKNGSVGLLLLIVTGLGLMAVRGVPETLAWGGGAFHAKLGLVVVFSLLFGFLQSLVAKAKRDGGGPAMTKIPTVSRIMLAMSIAIVACAVVAFH
jgi:hypothetical protein